MPGGYLSFGIYQRLGGEREFGQFWLQLGLPTLALIVAAFFFLVQQQRIMSQKTWMITSIGLIAVMAFAVVVRLIR